MASRKSGPLVLLYWSQHESQRVVRWRDGTTLTSTTIIFKVGKRDVRGVTASGLELQSVRYTSIGLQLPIRIWIGSCGLV